MKSTYVSTLGASAWFAAGVIIGNVTSSSDTSIPKDGNISILIIFVVVLLLAIGIFNLAIGSSGILDRR